MRVEVEALLRVLLSPVFYSYVLRARLSVLALRMFATAGLAGRGQLSAMVAQLGLVRATLMLARLTFVDNEVELRLQTAGSQRETIHGHRTDIGG
jgi:hypothetical protein